MQDSNKKVIGLFPAHPAQVWILAKVAESMQNEYNFLWFLRDKDISLQLANELYLDYQVVSKAKKGILGNFWEMLVNIVKLLKISKKNRIDLWISKYSAVHIVSRFLGMKSIFFVDDDFEIVPHLYNLSCPFADIILLPEVTNSGPYKKKLHKFNGVFELIYLHPERFTPEKSIYSLLNIDKKQKYCIIRLASLTAHHDVGAKGISESLLKNIITLCDKFSIKVFITSEKTISNRFEKYRLPVPPSIIHHAIYFAEFLVGDSQTMASEAALLATPSFRINSFVGKISYLNDLESKKLSFGFRPGEEKKLVMSLEKYLHNDLRTRKHRTDIASLFEDPIKEFKKSIQNLI